MAKFLFGPGGHCTGATLGERHFSDRLASLLLHPGRGLLNPPGDRYEGGLRFPWDYGLVLTNLTESDQTPKGK
jgi:hypothetical protein